MIAAVDIAAAPVFVLELPLELAPTMNVWSSMKGWSKAKMRKEIDGRLFVALAYLAKRQEDGVLAHGRRRRVIVTRYSSREPDELACDTLGAKPLLDRLVIVGVLAGDSRKHIAREARWIKAKPGQGKLVLEVFDE